MDHRHSGGGGAPPHLRGRPVSGLEAAHANEYFEPFLNATTLKNILGYHRSMCEFLHLKPNVFPHFYPKLRANLTSWRAKALWKKFDARASHKCYGKGKVCAGTRVLIIGAGPCGLRTAIEAQLLGAKVVVIEKRDRLSRNNVLHLWPFVIEDLRMLGAKKFFGKFCAGAIDHISIRQLQCILLKVALLLGVEVHTEVGFEKLLEPNSSEKTGWRAEFQPENHPVSQYEFDVIIGADGKRNTLQGFKRKEFRGKLAIAITANFINKKTEAEARVEEISGVAFIFNQKFFKDLQEETRIDLENIVYYKDDTHYFVMTAKKASLLEKGVIKQDLSDTEKLLAPDNVDRDALKNYARQAADFSTNYQLPHLEFAVNHYGQPDVAMFDFTSMYAAEYASKVVERHGNRLLMILVGDSLLEPFWPTGSGCARGFLSSLDAAWAIRSYCSGQMTPLDVLAERESIYRLLAQTTPDNLNKDWKAYTLDPATRYPNLNKSVVTPHQTVCLYDADNVETIEKMKRASLEAVARHEHIPKKRRRGVVDNDVLVSWLAEQVREQDDIVITDIKSAFKSGKALCAIIHHYRPDLLDYSAIKGNEPGKCNQMALDILEKDLGVPPFMTGKELTETEDYLAMSTYLTQVYDTFRGEIPHIKHPKLKTRSKPLLPSGPPTNQQSKRSKKSVSDHLVTALLKSKNAKNSLKPKRMGKSLSKDSGEIFDLTYSDEHRTSNLKKSSGVKQKKPKSRNVCVYVNIPVAKKVAPKQSKLSAIPENIHEKISDKMKTLSRAKENSLAGLEEHKAKETKVLHCHTFIQDCSPCCQLEEEMSIKTVRKQNTEPIKRQPTIDSKMLNPLQVIRKHLQINKPLPTKISPENSAQSINIQLIHKSSSDTITWQNVKYRSSINVINITSRCNQVEEKNTLLSDFYKNQRVLSKDNTSSYLSSFRWACTQRRFPDFKHVSCRKSKKSAPTKQKSYLSPADTQIIHSLGTCQVDKLSSVKKTCFSKPKRGKELGKKRKFSLCGAVNERFEAAKGKTVGGKEMKMQFYDDDDNLSPQIYTRVQKWISQNDFRMDEVKKDTERETLITCDMPSDITSVTRAHARRKGEYDDIRVEERTDVVKCESPFASSQEDLAELVKNLKDGKQSKENTSKTIIKPATKFSQYNMKSISAPPANFSVIVEGEESELPESNKRSEFSFKSIKTTNQQAPSSNATVNQLSRPSSRHKRHAEVAVPKPCSVDRKQRKRRTLERIGPSVEERQRTLEEISWNRQDRQTKRKQQRQRQTEQFIKSMQMLQANCKPDCSEPFEDYSIFLYRQTAPKFQDRVKDLEKQFTYVPDHDTNKITALKPLANTNAEEDIASKIRSLEDKWSNQQPAEKKPKDLMRAIGKIETSDWNIKQIEKKILENKIGKPSTLNADKERVPRWSKEEFRARQNKMEKKHLERQDSAEDKFADIDRNIKQLDLKLKEGTNRELGQNKVASITEKLVSKVPEEKPIEKPVQPKQPNLPMQTASECCHFCGKRVYLMERLSAENRFFHHGCFKCQYCHTQLRLGSYMFDRDGQYGYRFFCMHHYGMQGELPRPAKVARKPSQKGNREAGKSPHKKPLLGVAGVDLLDRVQTPERIEFSNLSTGNISSDHEELLSQMDEDEWTDKNFGASCNELDDSDDNSSSSISDTDSDDEDAFDDALEQPITKEGTMKWAERWKNSYRKGRRSDSDGYSSSDHSSYYENSSDDSDSDTATEGEEEIRARELRRQEVRVEPPVVQTDTGTDTEVKKSLDILPPDILNDHKRLSISSKNLNKSPSNYSINSDIFNSAESDLDFNMNKHDSNVVVGKLSIVSKPPLLSKSATAGNLSGTKPKRNFVLPPREQRRSFGQEFTPKFKLEEPLLVIKRTPSKVNLPKEIKPKVAVNTKGLDTQKYFGSPKVQQKKQLQRSGTVVAPTKPPLVKQSSLPDDIGGQNSFNFELKDSDMDDIDNYIEDLLRKEDELEKPIDPDKFRRMKKDNDDHDEKVSSSIEDLFSALEKETQMPERELQKESEEKMEDLLTWMEELDHQTPERKVYRSVSDVKYKNLERLLKKPERSDSVVSKLPKNNVAFFEAILKGKELPKDSGSSSSNENLASKGGGGLARSKTEIHFNRSRHLRTSVDLDSVKKVNIKSVLQKFESMDKEDEEPKPKKLGAKRLSLQEKSPTAINRPKPISNTIKKFESKPKEFKKFGTRVRQPKKVLTSEWSEGGHKKSFEESMKDLEDLVDETIESIELGKSKSDWCVNVSVSCKVSPEYLQMQQEAAKKQVNPLDISKELQDFNEAMSALTTTEESSSEANNFLKAVESSTSSNISEDKNELPVEEVARLPNCNNSGVLNDEEAAQKYHYKDDYTTNVKNTSLGEEMSKPLDCINKDIEAIEATFINGDDLQIDSNLKVVSTRNNIIQETSNTTTLKSVDELYAKVKKPKKDERAAPPIPQRRKYSLGAPLPPPRAARQKSHELKADNNSTPVAPHRKRCNTVSPLPRRKASIEHRPLDTNGRSTSTSNLELKKAVVSSYELPGPQKVTINGSKSLSSEHLSKFPAKYGRKDKDKDCSIQ